MRAIVEAIGAFFGMPVSEGKDRRFRVAVVFTMLAGVAALVWLALAMFR